MLGRESRVLRLLKGNIFAKVRHHGFVPRDNFVTKYGIYDDMPELQCRSRVHFYIPSFSGGGAERVFVRIANYFAKSGVETNMVVNNAEGPARALLADTVSLHILGSSRTVPAVPKLAGWFARERPAVVFSALTPANLTAITAHRLARCNARIIVSERNQYSASAQTWSPIKRRAMDWLVRGSYPSAHAITAVAGGVADDLATVSGVPRGRIQVIYNPAPDPAEIDTARSSASPHPFFEAAPPVILAIGRLVGQKDYPTLLSAFSRLREASAARLIILGSGPDEGTLRRQAAELGITEDVAFEGFRMNRFDYLVRSSVYVMSSINEGFPNTLVEALAAGIPVVCTDCAGNGPREILADDYPEALTPVGDVSAMTDAIRHQLSAPKNPQSIARIAERFSIDAIARQYAELAQ